MISEIKNSGNGYIQEEKFHSHWNYISNNDVMYKYEPDIFSYDGKETEWEEYEKAYMNYMYSAEVKSAKYVYEGIDYNSNVSDIYKITEGHYDELYADYYSYLSDL